MLLEIDASEATDTLHILGFALGNLEEPMTRVLTMALEDSRREIVAQGALFGPGWPAMSPWTTMVAQELYGRTRDPMNLLDDSGGLLESLTPGGAGNILEVHGSPIDAWNEGEAGTAYERGGFPVAVAQQKGTSKTFRVLSGGGFSPTGIPPRPFLGWHEQRLDEYAGVFARHIFDGVDGFRDPMSGASA